MQPEELQYVGFWPRVGASIIDTLLIGVLIWPLLTKIYGTEYWFSEQFIQGPADLLFSWVLPAFVVLFFWIKKQATPGKMALSAKILDAKTGLPPTTGQYIRRYLGYYVAIIPLFLGIIWVAFDPRKQGWHDKIAGTVVVRPKAPEQVRFEEN